MITSLALAVLCFLLAYTLNMTIITVGYHRGLAHGAVALAPRARRFLVRWGIWLTGIDPLLFPLAMNGGPVETRAPSETSLLLDAGDAAALLTESTIGLDVNGNGTTDIILIDNLRGDELRRAVELIDGRAVTEASGNVTPDTAAEVAASGVDVISLGWITHSAPRLDVALDL